MLTLHNLKNTTRAAKSRKRVGRGLGSKLGKTCGRGQKGARARAGSKMRWGKEGGNVPLFMKLPIRGFSNAPFRRLFDVVNLERIDAVFREGEVVTREALLEKGLIKGKPYGVKVLGKGEIKKSLRLEVQAISKGAREKLTRAKIDFRV